MSLAGPANPNWPLPGLMVTPLIATDGRFVGMIVETLLEVNRAKNTFLELNRWSTRALYALPDCVLLGSNTKLLVSCVDGPVLGSGYNLRMFAAMGSTGVP